MLNKVWIAIAIISWLIAGCAILHTQDKPRHSKEYAPIESPLHNNRRIQ